LLRIATFYALAVPQPLPRAFRLQERAADERKLAQILLETGEPAPPPQSAGATAPGDGRRLRGIPAVGKGSAGTMFGTDPLRALLAKEQRRRS
jgi:hypothetical protein